MAQSYDGSVNSLVAVTGKYQAGHTPEKLYLHLDKSTYKLADTLWFKAYLFNASSLQASATSTIVYIEITDENNVRIFRRLVPLTNGLGSGYIALIKRDFPEGGYTLRAYTQWMRNFDEQLIFKKQFYVSNINRDKWLINFNSVVQDKNAQLHLQLLGTDKRPVSGQQVLLGVKQDDWVLRRDKPQVTSTNGELDLAVTVRGKPEPIYASLHKGSYDDKFPVYKFPVIYNRPQKADVQFMPEGGHLVAGTTSTIGIKAIGEDGKCLDVSGAIINSITNQQVAVFNADFKGMGSFSFVPQAGVTYKAFINLPDGIKKEYPFPDVKPAGTVLNVINSPLSDSIAIKITASPGLNNQYILLGQSRGLTCYGAKVNLSVNNTQTLKAPKKVFASGIVKFTLLNKQLVTLNERIVYIDQKDNLQINISPDKNIYSPQDSIALNIEIKDSNDNPVLGAFSMSVISDQQLNSDPNNSSITTNLLLTSDLKGNIESPNYYFTGDHQKELDNLLLTQGWTGFDWKNILLPQKPLPFKPETDYSISGKVLNLFDKAVKGANIQLISFRPFYIITTKTDDNGLFTLKNVPQQDSISFIQAHNTKGNTATYEIQLDKPEWPKFSNNALQMPWYVNTGAAQLKVVDTIINKAEKVEKLEGLKGNVLQEVNIKATKLVRGSRNLNGSGMADQVIDDHDIAKVNHISLLELMQQQIKDFKVAYALGIPYYAATNRRSLFFIFDGIEARRYNTFTQSIYNKSPSFDYYTWLLTNYTSYDIKGIEVMSDKYLEKYTEKYDLYGDPPPIIIEITTKEGTGPFLKQNPGAILYKPTIAVENKQFYRPRYLVKNATVAAFDDRTTIHWEPNIITDKDGKATVSFYAAGQPDTYTIITEGSNMNGNVGSTVQKITIKATQP